PTDAVLRSLVSGFESFERILKSDAKVFSDVTLAQDDAKNIVELYMKQHEDKFGPLPSEAEEKSELPVGQMDVFTALSLSDYLKTVLLADNVEQFGQP